MPGLPHLVGKRNTRITTLVVLFALAAVLALVEASVVHRVTVVIDGKVIPVTTLRTSVAGVLDQIGFPVRVSDSITPGLDADIADGDRIVIKTAFPVTVKVGESIHQVQTPGGTVERLLADLGIELSALDKTTPSLDTLLQPGMDINVVRVSKTLVTEREPIPFGVLRWAEPKLEKGKTTVLRQGREGVKELIYEVVTENGKEVSRKLVAEKVVQKPRDKIIGIGTKIVVRTLMTAAGPIRYVDVKEMEATAYYPGPESTGKWADGITATGMKAGHGVVAVDPRVIPLGTRLFIPGYGLAVAADVGGAIKGNRIDLCFDTYREAVHFGRRKLQVYILQ